MRNLLCTFCIVLTSSLFSQNVPDEYSKLVKKADSLYNAKDYKNSTKAYSAAFKVNGWKGAPLDRYNAACSAALANIPDTAFFYLNRAALGGYSTYNHISTDTDLATLHEDKRWKEILEKVKANKDKEETNLNKPLAHLLDSIYREDQEGRQQIDGLMKKYGWESKEVQALWKEISYKDSINLIKITAILDKYGWLGADEVGKQGNSTLFLVIQHSDQKTQEKYLPMMREAVKNRKAQSGNLALLEDRVALGQGKKQIYGSQVGQNLKSKTYYVLPLEDPDNVDKRRAEVGLPPLAEYLNYWQMKWDPEQYKKELVAMKTEISSVTIDDKGKLLFTVKNEKAETPIIIEHFEGNNWKKVGEILGVGGFQEVTYNYNVKLNKGENSIRVSITEKETISKEVKYNLKK